MGNNQTTSSNWEPGEITDNEQRGVVNYIRETTRLSGKYFGTDLLANDPSMHQMQQDLLSVDESIKRWIFRKKPTDQYDEQNYQQQQAMSTDQTMNSFTNGNYSQPFLIDRNLPPSVTAMINQSNNDGSINTSLFWRCSYCTADNKITENACRRCKQAETKL